MPDRSPDGPRPRGWVAPPADPTRDIRMPPLPDRPAPAVRPEWAPYVPASGWSAAATPGQEAAAPRDDGAPPPATAGLDADGTEPSRRQHDLPTDRLASPRPPGRSTTLSFEPPPPVQLLKVSVGPRPRQGRWLWVLAILLPLLVIAGSGIWLFLEFYGR